MARLSATIITFNEEKHIGRCIASLQAVADEIIVVDSHSTDRTKDICLEHGVIFIEQPFLGYMEQKNFALDKASYQHVLSLDADEALSEELARSIAAEKEKGFPAAGYTMNRFNYYCGRWIRHGTYYPDRKLRLVDTKQGRWGVKNPHERIVVQESAVVKQLSGDLLHYTYQSIEAHMRQMDRFSTIAAQTLFDRGKRPSYWKMITHPAWAFFKGYVIKRGFLDGFAGFMIARMTAIQSFLKYAKHIRLHQQARNTDGKI